MCSGLEGFEELCSSNWQVSFILCMCSSGLQGFLGPNHQVVFGRFVCTCRASKDSGALAIGYYMFSVSCVRGSRDYICGSSCQVSCVFVCSLRASRDTWSPTVRNCLFVLFVLAMPREIRVLQLSGIICFHFHVFWARGSMRLNLSSIICFLYARFGSPWIPGLQPSGIVCSFCLFSSCIEGLGCSSCWALYVLCFICSGPRDFVAPAVRDYEFLVCSLRASIDS